MLRSAAAVLLSSGTVLRQVWAVHRCRVPVVKTTAPQKMWGPTGWPCRVDISVNNIIAVYNTRLLKAYADLVKEFAVPPDACSPFRESAVCPLK